MAVVASISPRRLRLLAFPTTIVALAEAVLHNGGYANVC